MKMQLNGEWHEILGAGPTPKEVQRLFLGHERVGQIQEAYEGELKWMYRSNGYYPRYSEVMRADETPLLAAGRILEKFQGIGEHVFGPPVIDRTPWIGAIALWVPRIEVVRNYESYEVE